VKHYRTQEWIDFVNQAATETMQMEMQQHLDSGCKSCADSVAIWQRVRQGVAAEAGYQPPDGIVRMAKAMFAANALAEGRNAVSLLFDSFAQPLLAGVRSTSMDARQMLYHAGSFFLHLQISARTDTDRISVMGQLLNPVHPDEVLSEASVVVSNRKGGTFRATTNQFGEFAGEVDRSDSLDFQLPGVAGKEIVVSVKGLDDGRGGPQ
jgi:hypothetical protein